MKIVGLVMFAALLSSALGSLEPLGYQSPSNQYLQPPQYQGSSYKSFRSPSSTYLPITSSSSYLPPSKETYLPPSKVQVYDSRHSSLPSTSYGLPELARSSSRHNQGYSYSSPQEDSYSEPAKYDFGYSVKDGRGNDYGHQESRNGAKTRGRYYVLLPDGRKQIVEYEADEDGYRPKISYEQTDSSYDRSSSTGYPSGPY